MSELDQSLLSRPDFIARFGEQSPEIARLMMALGEEAQTVAMGYMEQINAHMAHDPLEPEELQAWLACMAHGMAPESLDSMKRAIEGAKE